MTTSGKMVGKLVLGLEPQVQFLATICSVCSYSNSSFTFCGSASAHFYTFQNAMASPHPIRLRVSQRTKTLDPSKHLANMASFSQLVYTPGEFPKQSPYFFQSGNGICCEFFIFQVRGSYCNVCLLYPRLLGMVPIFNRDLHDPLLFSSFNLNIFAFLSCSRAQSLILLTMSNISYVKLKETAS